MDNPERARYRHLVRSGSQSQRRIPFMLPAHGASHNVNNKSPDVWLWTDVLHNKQSCYQGKHRCLRYIITISSKVIQRPNLNHRLVVISLKHSTPVVLRSAKHKNKLNGYLQPSYSFLIKAIVVFAIDFYQLLSPNCNILPGVQQRILASSDHPKW